jgi:hypothetical protein
MPYDGSAFDVARDPILGRLTQARSRLADRGNWIAGKYFEEDSRGYHYCILGALSADPARDGCMAQDAVGQETAVWLARHLSGVEMSFTHASRIIYNFNDGFGALEAVSHSVAGLFFFARRRHVNGHARVLGVLDGAIAAREDELRAGALAVS